ncbi:MAG: hypothetical protein Ct9H90mP16_22270 [Candidatus Poseidoniales archaeon]|nr:MAG: hypothetical protein Ct9H90mP16_22270 [Candidatus Poseidoniales archaeon]
MIAGYEEKATQYRSGPTPFQVRGRGFSVETTTQSLAHTSIPKVALPNFAGAGDLLGWLRREKYRELPLHRWSFPFKRADELPTRMFAGEGPASRTNKRFHYLSKGEDYARLSTAFDSVTLYGRDPHTRPDIYGKVGESGSASTL